jgi:hypothetical protein
MQQDLINFKRYYLEASTKVPTDSFFHQSINHKYKHSIDVLRCGQKIMQNSPEFTNVSAQITKVAEQALLFHDVGRFEEAVKRYEISKNNKLTRDMISQFDHGLIGYNLLKNNQQYNDSRILFAVRYHGKMMEDVTAATMWQEVQNSPQRDEILPIFYLVRDADKMANFQAAKNANHLQEDMFYKQLSDDAKIAPLTSVVIKQFIDGKTILSSTLNTFADRILQVLSWIYDFNYQYTKTVFLKQGYAQFLYDELAKYHTDKNDLQKIRKIVF